MATRRRRYRRRRSQNRFWILVLVCLGIGGYWFYTQQQSTSAADIDPNKVPALATVQGDAWWDNSFAYRQKIQLTGTGSLSRVTFDHASLVVGKQSNADGSDIRVIAQIGDATDTVGFSLSKPNTNATEVTFDTSKYTNANYYLYFGSKLANTNKVLGLVTGGSTSQPQAATLATVETPQLVIKSERLWQLIVGNQLELNLSSNADVTTPGTRWFYGIDANGLVEIFPISAELSIKVPNVTSGEHTVYLVSIVAGNYTRSNSIAFKASSPVYVAWSIDWEGYNVPNPTLTAIEGIANKYGIPMTHFFNPRIYIDKTIPSYRRSELTNWVKNRHETKSDEIAMHMHMQYDMVRAAGLEPFTSPRWGTGVDGYDVLTSAYNYDQFAKIVDWGLQQFEQNGLPRPAGYRAGGWFANLDTLKVLNDKGFVYDSSGRETYTFGRQNKAGYWKLDGKTQPYQPSSSDQNSSEPPPVMKLWEVPNNGNDSYWFGTDHMIARFYENYREPGKASGEKRLVTYLSHPDWFDVDQPKLEALFTEISKYDFADDKGPVVFSTISSALKAWQD